MILVKFTKEQYSNNECTHDDYYGQFVTYEVIELVKRRFFADILSSNDRHFNDVGKLTDWDQLSNELSRHIINSIRSSSSYSVCSLVDRIYVLKAAAKVIRDEAGEEAS